MLAFFAAMTHRVFAPMPAPVQLVPDDFFRGTPFDPAVKARLAADDTRRAAIREQETLSTFLRAIDR